MSVIKETKGSIVIAALIVTLITGTLVGLFLRTVTLEVQNSYRSRMSFQAVNLAEAGLDWAMYAMIKDDWSNWSKGSDGYYRDSFPDIAYSWKNERRVAKVYVEMDRVDGGGNELPPLAISEGTITLRNGIKVSRQIFVELTHGTSDDPTSGGFWGNGILGKIGLNFGGNKQTVDSFHTGTMDPSTTSVGDYYNTFLSTTILGDTMANPNGSAASMSVKIDDIILGNADIYGSIASGAAEGTDPSSMLGPNGSIYDSDSANADNADNWKNGVDTGNIGFEFEALLPDATPPAGFVADETGTIDLKNKNTQTIGDTASNYELTGVDVSGTLTVTGNVVMVLTGDLNVKGEIIIEPGATLELYVSGDIDVGGNGIANTGKPENFLIYHTQTEADALANGASSMKLHGTAPMSAAVYAPNTDISLRGGGGSGAFYGAVVGNSVLFSGNNYDFHYDEALADLGGEDLDPDDERYIPEVSNWVELTDASDKRNMATILTDGF